MIYQNFIIIVHNAANTDLIPDPDRLGMNIYKEFGTNKDRLKVIDLLCSKKKLRTLITYIDHLQIPNIVFT